MLKIVEVVVLIGAGLCFVVWQFRDLRYSREITRQQRETQQAQSNKANAESRVSSEERGSDGG